MCTYLYVFRCICISSYLEHTVYNVDVYIYIDVLLQLTNDDKKVLVNLYSTHIYKVRWVLLLQYVLYIRVCVHVKTVKVSRKELKISR